MEIHWHLTEGDFFEGLDEEKEEFVRLAKRRVVPKHAYIFSMGDRGYVAYYLQHGYVKIFRTSAVGKEPIVFIRRPGELFGLAEVMGGGERKCSAQAITRAEVYEIGRDEFELLLGRHFVLAKRVIGILGRRLRFLGEQIENLMASDVATRVLKVLLYLCYQGLIDSEAWNKPIKVPVKLTQEEMASMIGSCQQTVSEVLKALRDEGLVLVSRKEIVLLRPTEAIKRII